jgi:aldehyde dehydrogenase (NAD+)
MTTVETSKLPTADDLRSQARDALTAVGSRAELDKPGRHGAAGPATSRHGADGPATSRHGADGPATSRHGADGPATSRPGADGPATSIPGLQASTPITGDVLFTVTETTAEQADAAIAQAAQAFTTWRTTPAPIRGALVARLGELLVEHKADLATLVTIEAGKITSEALGEVQEMIDICQFAVGLSRQLYGKTIASERQGHRLMETWHPLGVVGVITAFNFPVAVWSWNTAIALVCGDTVVWKPSELTPLTALACQTLIERAAGDVGAPREVSRLVQGGREVGERLVDDPRVALLSATGSVRMGQQVGPRVAQRFGKALLELGGNNAAIVTPSADLDLAVRGIVFSAAGTAGQRCTTLRRLIVHSSVADELVDRIVTAYRQLPIGDPAAEGTLVGPLIHETAYRDMVGALEQARADGGEVSGGERRDVGDESAYYVAPAVVRMPSQTAVVHDETFAPILYVLTYEELDDAIALNNAVPQGLSSSIFTLDVREAERFMAADGSDCGIANVNIGTSGAEIGGAFGGEKQTGGGRESGSDAWKAYMRRATNTVNYSAELPLAQGVHFG